MSLDRELAGLTCRQVLDRLGDYLDGDLAPAARAAVETHLRGCDACARLGGAVGAVVGGLRQRLGGDAPADVAARLSERLAREAGEA